jgi:uncharacterized membrane protein
MASLIGGLACVAAHTVIFAGWIAFNIAPIRAIRHFDPAPLLLLDVLLGFEATLVASFILIRQSRMSHRAEERDQIVLQMLLLSEISMNSSPYPA